jgi:hypothetical protein
MSTKNKFWLSFFVIALAVTNWFGYEWFSNEINGYKETTYCGKVIDTSTKEEAIKHGTRTDMYLTADFEKIGVRSIQVSPTTYYTKKPGEIVCFDLTDSQAGIPSTENVGFEIFSVSCFVIAGILNLIAFACIITFSIEYINRKLDEYDE